MSTPAVSSFAARLDEIATISRAMGLSFPAASRLLRTMESAAPLAVTVTPADLLPAIVNNGRTIGALVVVL